MSVQLSHECGDLAIHLELKLLHFVQREAFEFREVRPLFVNVKPRPVHVEYVSEDVQYRRIRSSSILRDNFLRKLSDKTKIFLPDESVVSKEISKSFKLSFKFSFTISCQCSTPELHAVYFIRILRGVDQRWAATAAFFSPPLEFFHCSLTGTRAPQSQESPVRLALSYWFIGPFCFTREHRRSLIVPTIVQWTVRASGCVALFSFSLPLRPPSPRECEKSRADDEDDNCGDDC